MSLCCCAGHCQLDRRHEHCQPVYSHSHHHGWRLPGAFRLVFFVSISTVDIQYGWQQNIRLLVRLTCLLSRVPPGSRLHIRSRRLLCRKVWYTLQILPLQLISVSRKVSEYGYLGLKALDTKDNICLIHLFLGRSSSASAKKYRGTATRRRPCRAASRRPRRGCLPPLIFWTTRSARSGAIMIEISACHKPGTACARSRHIRNSQAAARNVLVSSCSETAVLACDARQALKVSGWLRQPKEIFRIYFARPSDTTHTQRHYHPAAQICDNGGGHQLGLTNDRVSSLCIQCITHHREALAKAGIANSTTIFITAKHGQSPRDPSTVRLVACSAIWHAASNVHGGTCPGSGPPGLGFWGFGARNLDDDSTWWLCLFPLSAAFVCFLCRCLAAAHGAPRTGYGMSFFSLSAAFVFSAVCVTIGSRTEKHTCAGSRRRRTRLTVFLLPLQLVTLTAPNGYPNSTAATPTVLDPAAVINAAFNGSEPAQATEDDVSLIWLFNQNNTAKARMQRNPF